MLERIKSPKDLKKLNYDELKCLSGEIREFLVEHVSKTGGHLAANLGVVELTLALFLEFDPYCDKIVWDVGHQAYVHKILTGRADKFYTLRQEGGISGFPKISESDADAFNTGHSSTSISAATGFAAAAMLSGNKRYSVAVIGDGAMTGGMAYEALNHAGSEKLPVIVILNDNGMSISKNVGGVSEKLKKIRITARYLRLKANVKTTLDSIPVVGTPVKHIIQKLKECVRSAVLPGVIFEDFGFKYLGPVDGHNIPDMREVLNQAKDLNEPVLVHIHTKKGKGYPPAEKYPDFYHGVSSFDEKTGADIKKKTETWSDFFGDKLCDIAENNKKVVAVTAAMPQGTGLEKFAEKFPKRFFDVGIAEQHAITFCAAMAQDGMVPVAAVYSTFLQRAFDQVLHDVSLMKQHVVFCVDRCGPVGSDGETHQGVFDIAYLMRMPNMHILSPCDKSDFKDMLDFAINYASTPVAIRYPRGKATDLDVVDITKDNNIKSEAYVLKSRFIREGRDVFIAAVGITVYDALKAADVLMHKGISAAVCDVRVINPIDKEFMTEHTKDIPVIVSLEDGVVSGGFGQQLAADLNRNVLTLGYPIEAIEQGTVEQIKKRYSLDYLSIADRIEEYFKNQNKNTLR